MTAYRDVFSQLVRLEIELWDAVDTRLRNDLGLPLTRYEPMQVIDEHDACRVSTIATELVITVGGASKLVDRIQASGYCRRRRDVNDARSSIIELTPSGKKLLAKATASLEDELSTRLGVLSPRALTQFSSAIAKLRASGRGAGNSGQAAS